MAFLDNSCDIILDAVLTDHGRKVLSKGDGSFQITKFALCDEEIDYSLYNKNHTSGSAYYDLEILQTPVLEAITDNLSSMKTKLISYPNENILYLPLIKINENMSETKRHSSGMFIIACDTNTEGTSDTCTDKAIGFSSAGEVVQGVIMGASLEGGSHIRCDQGLDTTEVSPKRRLDADLIEDSYMVQLDNRLGSLASKNGDAIGADYIDDDNVAFYTITRADGVITDNNDESNALSQTIAGPRGTTLELKIAASIHLNTSTHLFDKLGGTTPMTNAGGTTTSIRKIDTLMRVTGMKTGYTLDIPLRFVKAIN